MRPGRMTMRCTGLRIMTARSFHCCRSPISRTTPVDRTIPATSSGTLGGPKQYTYGRITGALAYEDRINCVIDFFVYPDAQCARPGRGDHRAASKVLQYAGWLWLQNLETGLFRAHPDDEGVLYTTKVGPDLSVPPPDPDLQAPTESQSTTTSYIGYFLDRKTAILKWNMG